LTESPLKGERTKFLLLAVSFVPMFATLVFGIGRGSPLVVALVAGIGIGSAGFALAWGVESLQFVVSQVLALAVLAVVQVMPEYSVEVVLAYRGAMDPTQLHFATAAMTGANRLLLGLGWPMVFVLNYFTNRKSGVRDLRLEGDQSIEVLFLGIATAYAFVIVVKGWLGVFDAFVLGAIFVAYLYIATRLPAVSEERAAESEGPPKALLSLKGAKKGVALLLLLGVGGGVILFASEPFVNSMLSLGSSLNINRYLLVQWLAPVLTELPETTTVFYWASRTGKGGIAMANLVSSKLNQWTLLIGTIPVVYAIALGGPQNISLTHLQIDELLLTAAQSLYGFVCLMDLKLSPRQAGTLALLFAVQFVFAGVRLEVAVAYLVLAAFETVLLGGKFEGAQKALEIIRAHID
jgi:cation:H+ antiporter